MRAAPAVSVACSGGLSWRLVRTLLPALAAAAFGAWLLQHLQHAVVWAVLPVALAAGLAWRSARPLAAVLVFDGQRWTCDAEAGEPEVMLDLDRALLLRWRFATGRAPRWLAVTGSEARGALHGLRVALYAARQAAAAAQT
jgi:hypothetical protein